MDERRRRFEAQVLPHLDAAYRFARHLARSPDAADDIVQDSMLRAFRSIDALRGTDAKAWLLAIVRNCHLTAVQKQQRHPLEPLTEDFGSRPGIDLASDASSPEQASVQHDEQREVSTLLAKLPETLREVLTLREIEDMDYRQIAATLAVPIGTVMSRLARARAALRKAWLGKSEEVPHAVPR